MTEEQQAAMLRAEMDKQRVVDPELRAGIAAIAMGESGFEMKPELGYGHTVNTRIRGIFGARVSALNDDQLNMLKRDSEAFFNRVYGGNFGRRQLGNTEDGDGFRFRGRGLFQLTGRANYARYGRMIGVDLLTDPEVANTPEVACAVAVAYMRDRYHGGGWDAMKRAVGFNIADIEATKDRLFDEYMRSGEFSGAAVAVEEIHPILRLTLPHMRGNAVNELQRGLAAAGYDPGRIDGIFGQSTEDALVAFQIAGGLTADGVCGPLTWMELRRKLP